MAKNARSLVPLAVTASVGTVWVGLRLFVFGTFIFPLTYLLPLLLVVWTRNTLLLWLMAGAFAALHTFQQWVRLPADALPASADWATYGATMFNILVGATSVHLIIASRERLHAHEAQARHDAEERQHTLEALLDHIPLGITIADAPDVRIRAVSRFGLGLTGRAAAEVQGIPVDLHAERWRVLRADGVTPATNDELPLTRATVHGETVRGEEWMLERPDGTRVPILCTAAPIRDARGRVQGGVIGWQDITERKQSEEALRKADARYRTLFDAIDEGVCIIEVLFDRDEKVIDYRFVETNPAFEKQTGLLHARGKRMRDLDPRHEQHWFETYGRIALTGQPARFESRAEQLRRWYDVHAFRIGDPVDRHVAVLFSDITTRKEAGEALRDSKERLRLALAAANGGGYVFDLPSQTLQMSPEAARVYGVPEDTHSLSKADALDLILPEDRHIPEAALQQAVATNGVYRAEYRTLLPDGRVRAVASFAQLQVDSGRLVGLVMDVTERRASEDALRDREEQLRRLLQVADRRAAELLAVIESMPDAVYMGTADGITRCNTNALRMLGATSLEDLQARIGELGAKFSVRWPDSGRLLRDDELQFTRALEGEAVTEEVLATNAQTGEDIHIRSACAPIVHEGAVIGAVAINSDITGRKRAEEAIRMRERDLARAQAAAHLGNWSWDVRNDAVVWSEELYRIFGVDPETFRPSNAAAQQLVHPEDRDRHAERVGMALTGRAVAPFESRIIRPTGEERIVLASGFEVAFDALGKPATLFGTVLDITDRKRAEEALQEANVRLEEADRRKDEFIAVLSHELRNPLAPIRYAMPLLERERLTEPAGRAVAVINRQVDHLARLVDDLLDVSRITRGTIDLQREDVTLASILTPAIEAASPALATARHTLKIAVAEEPVWLHADAARLTQVVTNLLNNSAKFTPRGGGITLEAGPEDGQAVIRVRDSGMGIPADALPTIFEMFHQVNGPDRSQGGLGIGLALVKRLVEMHGGRIEVHSEGVGHGAEFVVRLPVATDVNPTVGDRPSVTVPSAGRRLKVLIVDDNADLVEMLATVVGSLGHDVRKALDGQSAISAARSYRPDVVLLDLGLPVMSGIEVARELRQHPETAHVQLVAVTGWGQSEDRRQTSEAGFDHHLTKPTDPRVLEQLLATFATERPS